jgi:hypothetical protein
LILYHPVPNGISISISIPLFTFYNLPLSQLSSLSIVIGRFSFPRRSRCPNSTSIRELLHVQLPCDKPPEILLLN